MRVATLFALMLLLSGVSHGESRVLKFVKQIGVATTNQNEWMSFVAFNPDGTMVVSDGPGPDGSHGLSFWSFPTGGFIKSLATDPSSITRYWPVISRDWRYYVRNDSIVELKTGKQVIALPKGASGEFSADSRYFAESLSGKHNDNDETRIRVVAVPSGKQVSTFDSHTPFSMAISPDDRILAAGHWDIVKLWDVRTGKRLAVLRGFGRYVDSISFSRDGKLLATGTDFGGLQIWNVRRRKKLQSLSIAGLDVSVPAFSPDGKHVAVGTYGTGTVWLVDVASGKIVGHAKVSDAGCGSASFSPDGRYLITPSTGGLIKWPYDYGGTIRVFKVGVQQTPTR